MTVTINMPDGADLILTPSEISELIASMERRLMVKERIIQGLEELHVDSVNDMLKLARENDDLTEVLFSSPVVHKNEHQV